MKLPIFPLNTVLFPGGVLALRVFEARYMDMARACLREGSPFGVCRIADGASEVASQARPEAVGCTARIAQCDMEELGLLKLRVLGGERFRIIDSSRQADGLLVAEVEPLTADRDEPLPAEHAACARLLQNIVAELGEQAESDALGAAIEPPWQFESTAWVGNRLAELLPVPLAAKQKLMELDNPISRIEIIHTYLRQQDVLST